MANHITALRIKAGIKTAKKAAEQLNISAGMMYQMEEGIKRPSSSLAVKMANLWGCKLDEIFLPYHTTDSDKALK